MGWVGIVLCVHTSVGAYSLGSSRLVWGDTHNIQHYRGREKGEIIYEVEGEGNGGEGEKHVWFKWSVFTKYSTVTSMSTIFFKPSYNVCQWLLPKCVLYYCAYRNSCISYVSKCGCNSLHLGLQCNFQCNFESNVSADTVKKESWTNDLSLTPILNTYPIDLLQLDLLDQWFPNFLQSRTPSDIQSPATYPTRTPTRTPVWEPRF